MNAPALGLLTLPLWGAVVSLDERGFWLGGIASPMLAGAVAGAISMAAGEWVSVTSQNDLIERELAIERRELVHNREHETEELAAVFIDLQDRGCHNINWVSPSHQVPQLVRALALAVTRGLTVPMLVILIGVIGGMVSYGIIGLFIGPIILAFTYSLFMIWLTAGDAPVAAEMPEVPPAVERAAGKEPG